MSQHIGSQAGHYALGIVPPSSIQFQFTSPSERATSPLAYSRLSRLLAHYNSCSSSTYRASKRGKTPPPKNKLASDVVSQNRARGATAAPHLGRWKEL
jgi:hypothetical protein